MSSDDTTIEEYTVISFTDEDFRYVYKHNHAGVEYPNSEGLILILRPLLERKERTERKYEIIQAIQS